MGYSANSIVRNATVVLLVLFVAFVVRVEYAWKDCQFVTIEFSERMDHVEPIWISSSDCHSTWTSHSKRALVGFWYVSTARSLAHEVSFLTNESMTLYESMAAASLTLFSWTRRMKSKLTRKGVGVVDRGALKKLRAFRECNAFGTLFGFGGSIFFSQEQSAPQYVGNWNDESQSAKRHASCSSIVPEWHFLVIRCDSSTDLQRQWHHQANLLFQTIEVYLMAMMNLLFWSSRKILVQMMGFACMNL